jgi:hypothetical protein
MSKKRVWSDERRRAPRRGRSDEERRGREERGKIKYQ